MAQTSILLKKKIVLCFINGILKPFATENVILLETVWRTITTKTQGYVYE
jgi:hypothetical protein